MQFITCALPGVVLIEPDVHRDPRGFFLETYHETKYRANGVPGTFVQDNHSMSSRGTLRGLHLQLQNPQGKLVRVVQGEIWDVAVDVRHDSPTFRQWFGVALSFENFKQIYIPPGYAHGFCVLSDVAQVEYKCTTPYDPSDEWGIAYDDAELAVDWPIANPLLSRRDAANPSLAAFIGSSRDRVLR
jgi:dTDP-4-dehydrorhamnose 3,5-epimerase